MAQMKFTKMNQTIVDILKQYPDGLTLAEICEKTGVEVKSGHMVSTGKKGLIEVIGEREIEKIGKGKRTVYKAISFEPQLKDGKQVNYTDSEKQILEAIKGFEGDFTLADLSNALNRKLTSGHVSGLEKKGNIEKNGEIQVPVKVKRSVNVYAFVADIPSDAEVR